MDCFVASPAMTERNRPLQRRHHRACPGDPRPGFVTVRKTWMRDKPGHDDGGFSSQLSGTHTSALSRRENARALPITTLEKIEGAGNAGCALHPQSRVQKVKSTR